MYAVLFMLVNLARVQQAWPNQRALDTILHYGWMTYAKDQCVLNTIHILLNSRMLCRDDSSLQSNHCAEYVCYCT